MRRVHPALPLLSALVFTACSKSSTATPASTTAPATPAVVQPPLPPEVTPVLVAQGDSIFNNTVPQITPCARCHGAKGVGAQNGPSLINGPWLQITGSYEEIVATITNGVTAAQLKNPAHQLAMRPRGGPMQLTDPQIKAVAAYVYSISRTKTKA